MNRSALVGTVILAACAPPRAPGEERPIVVAIEHEPHHQVVFESPLVRVFDVRVGHGDTTFLHVHADPHVGVVVLGSARWGQTLGRSSAVDQGDAVGTIFDNSTSPLPHTHRVANLDSVPVHYVMGQFLGRSAIVSAPLLDEPGLKLERETSRGRMYRIRLLPGQATSLHRHAQPGLSVQVNDGEVALTGDASAASSSRTGAGAWWWRAAGNTHAIRNASHSAVELIEVDWK